MSDKVPFIGRKFFGLRPGLWLICAGILMMIVANIIDNTPLRFSQLLMVIGALGLVASCLMERKEPRE